MIGVGCEDKYDNVGGGEGYRDRIERLCKWGERQDRIRELGKGGGVGMVGGGLSGIELGREVGESG